MPINPLPWQWRYKSKCPLITSATNRLGVLDADSRWITPIGSGAGRSQTSTYSYASRVT